MKQTLPLLFLFFLSFSQPSFAAIELQISNFEKTNDYYSVDVELNGASTGSAYFVQGMFTQKDQNAYFGFSWSQKGDWLKYDSSPDPEYIKANFPKIESGQRIKFLVKPDIESSKYIGPGEYLLKLKRYTGESTSGTYSNSLIVALADSAITPEPTASITTTPEPSLTPSPVTITAPTNTPVSTPTPTRPPTKTPALSTPTPSITISPTPTETIHEEEATVAGITTEIQPTPINIEIKKSNPAIYKLPFIVGVVTSSGAGLALYYRKKKFQDKIT